MEVIVMDTDFAYEYFSLNPDALTTVKKNSNNLFILAFTAVAELIKAASSKETLTMLNARLRKSKLEVLHIDENISAKALELIQQYHLSHAASIPDMLLAATALKYDCFLATCNTKHFIHIPTLKLLQHDVTPKRGGFLSLLS